MDEQQTENSAIERGEEMKFEWEKLGIKATLNKLIEIIENHVGSNEQEAHKNATKDTSGFASKELFRTGMGIRVAGVLADKYPSIFDLPAGLYETYGDFTDLPEGAGSGSIIHVRVERGVGERKQIWLTQGYAGTLWYYTSHTNAASYNPEGWTRLPRIQEVWSGTAKNANDLIDFNQQMTHFKSIRVWYELDDGDSLICKEFEANKSFALREFDVFNSSAGAIFFEMRIDRVSNLQAKVALNKGIDIAGKDPTSNMRIRKIEGVA